MAEAPSSDTTGISEWYRQWSRRDFDQHSFDPEVRRRAKEAIAADAKALHAHLDALDAMPAADTLRATPDPHAETLRRGSETSSLQPHLPKEVAPHVFSPMKFAAEEVLGVGAIGPLLTKAAQKGRLAEFMAEGASDLPVARLAQGLAHYSGKAAEAAKKAIWGTPGSAPKPSPAVRETVADTLPAKEWADDAAKKALGTEGAAKEVAEEVPIEDVIVESKRIQAIGQPLPLTLDEHVASVQEAFPDWPREEILQELKEMGVPTTPEGYAKFVDDQLVEMVEEPALGVARELVRQGKTPIWSNAYGPGQKGVWYRDKGVGPSPGEGHVLRDPNVKFAPLPDEALAQIRKEVAEEVAEEAPKAAGLPPKAATRAPFHDESVTARATEKIRESLKPGGEAVEETLEAVLEKFEGKTPRLQSIAESGRFDVKDLGFDEKTQRYNFEYTLKGTEDWPMVETIIRDLETGREHGLGWRRYNPEIVTAVRKESESSVRYSFELKPGWIDEVPTDDTLMYRGMSWEEWEATKRSGQLQSKGGYNLGPEQEGLTYYSSDAGSASYYASSFAPVQFKATPAKPAVVVAVRKRPGVRVEGTGEHEVGIRGPISTKEITGVWEGHPATAEKGSTDVIMDYHGTRDGSGSAPGSVMAWREGEVLGKGVEEAAQETAQAALPSTPDEINKAFEKLAYDQRRAPEEAMGRVQDSQLSQLYGYMTEHIGDLTHRMAQSPSFSYAHKGGFEFVLEKVDKTLRDLNHPYGFEREVREQIRSNIAFAKKVLAEGSESRDVKHYTRVAAMSPEMAEDQLRKLGQAYADEHKKLAVYNEVQRLANDAAIATGEQRFDDARRHLAKLKGYLDEGPDAWAERAMRVEPEFARKDYYDVADTAASAGARTVDEAADAAKQWQEKGVESPYFKRWFGDSKVVGEGGEPMVLYHGTTAEFDEFKAGEFGFHFGDEAAAEMMGDAMPVYLQIDNPLRLLDLGVFEPEAVASNLLRRGILDEREYFELLDEIVEGRHAHDLPTLTMLDEASEAGENVDALRERLRAEGYTDEGNFRQNKAKYEVSKVVHNALRDKGFDGIVYRNEAEGFADSYIAFEPTQIKSATGNIGTFDPKDARITYQEPSPKGWGGVDTGIPEAEEALAARPTGIKGMGPQEFEEALGAMTDAKDVTRFIAQTAENPAYRKIAARITPFIENTSFQVARKGDQVPRKLATGAARGLYTRNVTHGPFGIITEAQPESQIFVRAREIGEQAAGTNAETVLHEAIHAATVRRLADARLLKNKGTKLAEAREELAELFRTVAPKWKETVIEGGPGRIDEDELITWGLTNKNFQEFLQTIKIEGERGWTRFVRAVAKLLGIPPDEHNALSELLRVTDLLLEAPLEDLPLRIHTKGRSR